MKRFNALISALLCWYVVSVHDGDTFTLDNGISIRISGIDAPEMGQAYSTEARDALAQQILGKKVRIDCRGEKPSYGRPVCRVYVKKTNVGRWLVNQGYAYEAVDFSEGFYSADQSEAQEHFRGLWALPPEIRGLKPWEYRKQKKQKGTAPDAI